MAAGETVSGLAEDIFNWLLCVKSIYMSYKMIGGLKWIYESQQREHGRGLGRLNEKNKR